MNAFAKVPSPSASRHVKATSSDAPVTEAQDPGWKVECFSETGAGPPVLSAGAQQWLAENRAAIESSNAWVEKNGLPLARYRQF